MPSSPKIPPNESHVHKDAWSSLVSRSISAWDHITLDQDVRKDLTKDILQTCPSLEYFLASGSRLVMMWFFYLHSAFLSQTVTKKWSADCLDEYVILPTQLGYVLRRDCFFVSHYWQTKEHPDPDGTYLRLVQTDLEKQEWEYVWLDWTCMPQEPRSVAEETYFKRSLQTISGVIRNAEFIYHYPPWKAKL